MNIYLKAALLGVVSGLLSFLAHKYIWVEDILVGPLLTGLAFVGSFLLPGLVFGVAAVILIKSYLTEISTIKAIGFIIVSGLGYSVAVSFFAITVFFLREAAFPVNGLLLGGLMGAATLHAGARRLKIEALKSRKVIVAGGLLGFVAGVFIPFADYGGRVLEFSDTSFLFLIWQTGMLLVFAHLFAKKQLTHNGETAVSRSSF